MGNFSATDSRCRIDFFRDGGKWHETEDFDMEEFYFGSRESAARCGGGPSYTPREAVIAALRADPKFRREDGSFRYSGCWAVVLEPYHEFAHPQMFRVPERWEQP